MLDIIEDFDDLGIIVVVVIIGVVVVVGGVVLAVGLD